MRGVSAAAASTPASGIREIVNIAVRSPDVVRLEIGEPDFTTPAHIVDAVHAQLGNGVRYTQSSGRRSLREKLATTSSRKTGVTYTPDQIVVCQGAVQGVAALFAAVLTPGDEVLVPDPAWPNYAMNAWLLGARPVGYPLRPELGFVPDPDEVRSRITARTAILVINTPANPTGATFPADTVRALVELAERHDLLVLSDEVYDELIFDGEPANAAQYDPERVVMLWSFSKTYAMTGWRIGHLAAREDIAAALMKLQEPLISCVSEVSQIAAEAALDGPQDCVVSMRDAYRERRDRVVQLLDGAGVKAVRPTGAFYQMLPLGPGADSRAIALDMVERVRVSVAPGSAFGDECTDHVRISLASSVDVLDEGLRRILTYLDERPRGIPA